MQTIFFCDDNFIGNPHYAKDLIRELIPLNRSFRNPVGFFTQLSIDVAQDDELLEMLADANFRVLFIGIETPNKESLLETNKRHNYRTNLLEDVRKIHSYGMAIRAGMIVGFDHDDKTIFDQQFEFLQEAHIPLISSHLLRAPIGTRLWNRLRQEGRIVLDEEHEIYGNLHGANTNIIPARMTRVELFSGYLNLVERLSEWRNFEKRVIGFLAGIKREPTISQKKEANQAQVSPELFKYLLFSLDEEARDAIFRIIQYMRRHVPFLRQTVMSIITMQFSRVAMLQSMCKLLRERIELESSEAFKLDIDQTDLLLPEKVENLYQEIFTDIHQRVHNGLVNKMRTDDVVVEIFVDFITSLGKESDSFSYEDKTFLYELANRAIAKENSATKDVSSILAQSDDSVSDIQKTMLEEEILKAIEQELRGKHTRKGTHENSSYLHRC